MMRRKQEPAVFDLRPLRDELLELPCEPASRSHPRHWLFKFKRTLDFIGHARPAPAGFFRQVNPYPKPFRHVRFETDDGVTIAAWYGPPHQTSDEHVGGATAPAAAADEGRADKASAEGPAATNEAARAPFGIVLVPGMFSTKDDTVHKRRAIWLWRHWKIPVICIDMRAFGESTGIATGGWKESYDVHGAARFLKQQGVERVGVIAESMGGASALNALAYDEESEARIINGGTICFSAFVDLLDAVHYISTEPPRDDPFHYQWAGFRRLLRYKSHGGYERFDEYLEDAARVNGLSGFKEMASLANPKWKTSLIKSPVLLVHAADDPVVPVRHARRMERYAKESLNIQVITTGWGRHTGFESMEPWWFWEVLRRFFGTINGVQLGNPVRPVAPPPAP